MVTDVVADSGIVPVIVMPPASVVHGLSPGLSTDRSVVGMQELAFVANTHSSEES